MQNRFTRINFQTHSNDPELFRYTLFFYILCTARSIIIIIIIATADTIVCVFLFYFVVKVAWYELNFR